MYQLVKLQSTKVIGKGEEVLRHLWRAGRAELQILVDETCHKKVFNRNWDDEL